MCWKLSQQLQVGFWPTSKGQIGKIVTTVPPCGDSLIIPLKQQGNALRPQYAIAKTKTYPWYALQPKSVEISYPYGVSK